MQQVHAAYEQIKNPEAYQRTNRTGYGGQGYGGQGYGGQGYGGYGYDPFGGAWQRQSYGGGQATGDQYQQAAYQYILYGRYHEALNVLGNSAQKNARWYYLSALANDGLGNQVTAMEHIRRAVSMEPDNPTYLQTLEAIEHGGASYQRQAGNFRGFAMRGSPCASLCLCYFLQMFCCGRGFFCC